MAESPNAAISTAVSLIITPLDGATVTSTWATAGVVPNRLERRTVWPMTSPDTAATRPSVAHPAWGWGAEADNHLGLEPGLARPGEPPWLPISRARRIVILSGPRRPMWLWIRSCYGSGVRKSPRGLSSRQAMKDG